MNQDERKRFMAQFEDASAQISRLKVQTPEIFVEYADFLRARTELEQARRRFEAAEARWARVGERGGK